MIQRDNTTTKNSWKKNLRKIITEASSGNVGVGSDAAAVSTQLSWSQCSVLLSVSPDTVHCTLCTSDQEHILFNLIIILEIWPASMRVLYWSREYYLLSILWPVWCVRLYQDWWSGNTGVTSSHSRLYHSWTRQIIKASAVGTDIQIYIPFTRAYYTQCLVSVYWVLFTHHTWLPATSYLISCHFSLHPTFFFSAVAGACKAQFNRK